MCALIPNIVDINQVDHTHIVETSEDSHLKKKNELLIVSASVLYMCIYACVHGRVCVHMGVLPSPSLLSLPSE